MIYKYRRVILILSAIIAIIAISFLVYKLFNPSKPINNSAVSTSNGSIEVKGLTSTPNKIDDATQTAIQQYINNLIILKHGKGVYTATVRDNSYKRDVTPAGGVIVTLLIDIKETKETYLVTRTGAETSESGTFYIRCAPEDSQLVHPSVCRDIAND